MPPDTVHPLTEQPDITSAVKTSQAMSGEIVQAAEENTRQPKRELRLAVDVVPGLVWSALPDGRIDFLNQRWREYTGLTLEQASGWGWRAAIHPEDLPNLESYWRAVLASGKPGETEARLRRFDGEYRWFLFRAVPVRDEWEKSSDSMAPTRIPRPSSGRNRQNILQ